MSKKYAPILFFVILAGIAFFYNYHEIVNKRPQSIHKWRQSDCASIALNFYQGGMNFFRPETHNLTSDAGTSGKCLTSEIPILYYSVAILYKIFGYHDYVYRIFNTLLFFFGLFYLFKLFFYVLKDVFWASTLSILFFTSPVLVYYGNSFLSNSSALAFSIVGWYFFIRFYFEDNPKWFYISMGVFLLAGALKVTALLSVVAFGGIYGLELLGIMKCRENQKLFNKPLLHIIPFAAIVIIIGSWLLYANHYNRIHDCFYFSTTTFPIWTLDKNIILKVIENVRDFWYYQYFHSSVYVFLCACLVFVFLNFRKNNKLLIYSIIFIIAEVVGYVLLQFMTFLEHDYYLIELYILPIILVVATFDILKKHYSIVINSRIVKLVFSLFILFNIYYAGNKLNERYNSWMNDFPKYKDTYTITPYLRQLGISPQDTVISIPDHSHATLYLMNQKGWTEYSDARFNRGDRIYYNKDSAGIQHSINKGAKYLILNGIEELYSKTYLQSYCTNLLGRYNNVLIFDLKNKEQNFNVKERVIKKIYKCSAERLNDSLNNFVCENDSTIEFQNVETRSNEFVHNGSYSSKVDNSHPYGMTLKLNDLEMGESFVFRAWRKMSAESKGTIVVSGSNGYFNGGCNIIETGSDGWENVEKELFITSELANSELVIFFYNTASEPSYFDDFEIIRYKSVLHAD